VKRDLHLWKRDLHTSKETKEKRLRMYRQIIDWFWSLGWLNLYQNCSLIKFNLDWDRPVIDSKVIARSQVKRQKQIIVTNVTISTENLESKSVYSARPCNRKSPACVKRDLHTWNETCICEKRPTYVKRDQEKEANKSARPCNRKSPIYVKRDLQLWKETYTCEKRPMWTEAYTCEKRPTFVKKNLYMRKETYICEKRPTYVKRNLHAF